MDFYSIISITLIAALLVAYAQYLFKRNIGDFNVQKSHFVRLLKNKKMIFGVMLYVVSLLIYLVALHYGQLSFVYPTFASSFIFIALISKYVLKEEMNLKRIAGILLIVLGIIMVALTF